MYLWIVIVGGTFSFFASMGIGANDAANAFATSIGSKSLTIRNAVILAVVFESSGAVLMGNHVVNTIRKGIADYECFEDDPYSLMYGCMWVCLSVGMWLFVASKYEMPVSTTHSCVGAMIGMTICLKGTDCVIWYEEKETFPYIGGVSGIIISWIVSPVFSGLIASSIFAAVRSGLLRIENSFNRCIYIFPGIVGFCVTLNSFYIIYKGAKGIGLDETSLGESCLWSFGLGAGSAILTIPFVKKTKHHIETYFEKIEAEKIEAEEDDSSKSIENAGYHNTIISKDEVVTAIHDNAEMFDPKTEELFKFLQVFTAMCDSFSHGANDVANAVGPFATILSIYNSDALLEKNDLDNDAYWVLGLGGIGIAIGLASYGYKIINAIGIKLCKITPTRGISIELASALVIITGSRLEIPLSTTHCQVGATVGVALLEDHKKCSGVNKMVVFKTAAGWVLTLIIVGCSTAILVSQGAYAPRTSGIL